MHMALGNVVLEALEVLEVAGVDAVAEAVQPPNRGTESAKSTRLCCSPR